MSGWSTSNNHLITFHQLTINTAFKGVNSECIPLSTNTVSTMACFPQIFWSGLPHVNYEQKRHYNFAYLLLITYLTQQPHLNKC